MKYISILILSLSALIIAEEYEFEPVPNKAEYFSGKFNEGKNMQDLEAWAEEFVDWAEENNWRKSSITAIFKAKSTGDNMGRKILFGPSGTDDSNFDYVYSLYASSMDEFGESADNFMENLVDSPEAMALGEISSCSNARTYITKNIKQADQY